MCTGPHAMSVDILQAFMLIKMHKFAQKISCSPRVCPDGKRYIKNVHVTVKFLLVVALDCTPGVL